MNEWEQRRVISGNSQGAEWVTEMFYCGPKGDHLPRCQNWVEAFFKIVILLAS